MNIVTGIFVDQALVNAAKEKENYFVLKFRQMLSAGAKDSRGKITLERFADKVAEPEVQEHLRRVGINPLTAPISFQLLDRNGVGALDIQELVTGLLHLRENASTMDIALVLEELVTRLRDPDLNQVSS